MKIRMYFLPQKLDNSVDTSDITKGFLISADEIVSCDIVIQSMDRELQVNNRKERIIKIQGKFIGQINLEECEKIKSDFLYKHSLSDFKELWRNVPQTDFNFVNDMLETTYSDIELSPEKLTDNLTKHNWKTITKLQEWAESSEYKTVIIEMLDENIPELHYFNNTYVFEFALKADRENANASFSLALRQLDMTSKTYRFTFKNSTSY